MDTKAIGNSTINLQFNQVLPPPQPKSEVQQSKVNPVKESQDANVSNQQYDPDSGYQNRLDVIKQLIAERFTYPLGDSRITIYRDSKSGQYITMATSLRDGKVTYTPESSLTDNSFGSARPGLVTQA